MSELIKEWTTKAGLPAEIRMGMVMCGYVGLPKGHPMHGKHYDAIDADCHGGLTYAADSYKDGTWWVGFDLGHAGDAFTVGSVKVPGVKRGQEYAEAECESLAEQLAAVPDRSTPDE